MAKATRKALSDRDIDMAAARARRSGEEEELIDPAPRGYGRLVVRCTTAGSRLAYFRYFDSRGKRDSYPLGEIDTGAHPASGALTLQRARDRVATLSALLRSGVQDIRLHEERQRQGQAEAEVAARRAADLEREAAARGSLQALMDAYVASLVTQDGAPRQSKANVECLFRLHLTNAAPALVQRKAADITPRDIADALGKIVEAGKGRTAAKVRAYLRAAYSAAIRADLDPDATSHLRGLGVTSNPVDPVGSLSKYSNALDRSLTKPELRHFWKRLQDAPPTPARDAVLTVLLLGGQRPTQLLRAVAGDVDQHARTITLKDPKGRGRAHNPRRHVLPIPDELVPVIERRLALCPDAGAPLFSSGQKAPNRAGKQAAGGAVEGGEPGSVETPRVAFLREETAGTFVGQLCTAMQAAGELEKGSFTLRDIRRTAETHLAALGVSREVRAQLLSHGISGVQARHYDRHEYMQEKRDALAKFIVHLNGKDAALQRVA